MDLKKNKNNILSNSSLIIYAWEEFQGGLSLNPQTLLTTLGILPSTLVGKELPHEPNTFVHSGARIFVQVGNYGRRNEKWFAVALGLVLF